MIILLISFIILQIIDFASTTYILNRGGVELNKFDAWGMGKIGIVPFLAIKTVFACILGYYLYLNNQEVILGALTAFYGFVMVKYNLRNL